MLKLLQAAQLALAVNLCVFTEQVAEFKPSGAPLHFWLQSLQGFDSIWRAEPIDEGTSVRVTLSSGYVYEISFAYLATWYPGWEPYLDRKVVGARVLGPDRGMLELRLDDGPSFVTLATTILETCEPSFDAFGGVGGERAAVVEEGRVRFGKFRVYPTDPA